MKGPWRDQGVESAEGLGDRQSPHKGSGEPAGSAGWAEGVLLGSGRAW